jgi:hypothetical protein
MTSQPLNLDAIETRLDAATEGPWQRSEDYSDVLTPEGDYIASFWKTADGELIAHALEDITRLLTEIRRLRAQLTAVTALCDEQDMAARLFELPTPEWIVAVRRAIEPAVEETHVVADDSNDPEPYRFVDADGDYLHIGIPATPACGSPAISFNTATEPVHVPADRIDGLIATLRRLKAAAVSAAARP